MKTRTTVWTAMTRIVRLAILLVAVALPTGCGGARRPYAHDPLLRNGYGVRGDPTRTESREFYPYPEPVPPSPPRSSSQLAQN